MYRYHSTNKRNPQVYTLLILCIFIVVLAVINLGIWTAVFIVGIFPILRYSKPINEWIEIDESEIRFSDTFLNTRCQKIRSTDLKTIERKCERTVTQGKMGPIINDDWTINFIENSGKLHRTSDYYPPEVNFELLQFSKRNNLIAIGIEHTIKPDTYV